MSSKRKFQAVSSQGPSTAPERQRGSRTVLDDVSRRRAQQLHLEELQQDNFTETSGISVSGNLDAGVSVRRKRGGLEDEEVGVKEIHASSKKGHKRASIKRILTQKKNLAALVQESHADIFDMYSCSIKETT
ncbi:hypothetical protein PhCBS80983_g01057 [Powellomyces hirtus]|uniref:Uncharacterized protein n=1 Tax=Powellomyces hirtus TaxID=109895 RepID=A0A507EEB5_9FUNG|nr:hypothetical protein PhCBS80983_g01057 [Powellomyces hirtus]